MEKHHRAPDPAGALMDNSLTLKEAAEELIHASALMAEGWIEMIDRDHLSTNRANPEQIGHLLAAMVTPFADYWVSRGLQRSKFFAWMIHVAVDSLETAEK